MLYGWVLHITFAIYDLWHLHSGIFTSLQSLQFQKNKINYQNVGPLYIDNKTWTVNLLLVNMMRGNRDTVQGFNIFSSFLSIFYVSSGHKNSWNIKNNWRTIFLQGFITKQTRRNLNYSRSWQFNELWAA